MLIESIMTTKVITVDMDTSVGEMREIFQNIAIHHLLVVEEGVLIGIISDRDVLKSISPYVGTPSEMERDAYTLSKRAHQIMSRAPTTVTPQTPINEVSKLIIEHHFSSIPVLDEEGKVAGIVSWRDLLKHYAANQD